MANTKNLTYQHTTISIAEGEPIRPRELARILCSWDRIVREEAAKLEPELSKPKYYAIKSLSYNSPFFGELQPLIDQVTPVLQPMFESQSQHIVQTGISAFVLGKMGEVFKKSKGYIEKPLNGESTLSTDSTKAQVEQVKEFLGCVNNFNAPVTITNNFYNEEKKEVVEEKTEIGVDQVKEAYESVSRDLKLLEEKISVKKVENVRLIRFMASREFVEDETTGDMCIIPEVSHHKYPLAFSTMALKKNITRDFVDWDYMVDATIHYDHRKKIIKYIVTHVGEAVPHRNLSELLEENEEPKTEKKGATKPSK